jgi:hypothetical protein
MYPSAWQMNVGKMRDAAFGVLGGVGEVGAGGVDLQHGEEHREDPRLAVASSLNLSFSFFFHF